MKKVLLVEDSLTESEKMTRYLEQGGYSVYEVRSGEEAQLRLKQQKPDLILLDLILPGQSGFEFCRKLKADPITKAIPVVICSTKNTDVDRTWGNMSGADAYLVKPVDENTLLQTVSKFIR
ncbi:MAG: response regulator [Mojavia pulchra JT2-VF2]|jgi:twitching motility two-component system response regulator PilH|uniref:Response regulator n=1 Tax=Mojavia pulchra JT2-VF2 TaxID=287848 RepID=A0A951Q0W0_9NOST|nr:response regulator [Nostoc sp. 106C]MBW4563904.1 response regulator [Mojavia pulchra JT2-VF2]MDZ8003291.1 response regulator [Nostoc sp. DedSLP05]MDZ8100933.1 response regulator [Nostoc sp. DedSLP01]MDZ8168626.1 response regulator [Nostoc sp. CmiSLP01]MDZ8188582.1 response regulator [Nostoc sp. ChiSLP02]MDZ8288921.1 response regulator [Nostoc sp. ChiSLP01]OUL31911.1 two-component system response regulator [Nostoc sp. RF31YmG]BAY78813.1 response regulator receiver, CheY [Nostoc linckia NI